MQSPPGENDTVPISPDGHTILLKRPRGHQTPWSTLDGASQSPRKNRRPVARPPRQPPRTDTRRVMADDGYTPV